MGAERVGSAPAKGGPTTFGDFLNSTWLPQKRRTVRATTGYRYAWFVEHYINPAIGQVPLRRLRADHLDSLYENLARTGGREGAGLAPKTILEVHMIIRAALDQAVQRQLVVRNVAHHANARRRPPRTGPARIWTAAELRAFLTAARHQRLYPALHLVAHTGLRRGELVGLRWSDLDEQTGRLSVCRMLQTVAGQPVEFGVKTRSSRRTVDLDRNTIDALNRWRNRLRHDDLPNGPDEAMFRNTKGRPLHPESTGPPIR
jgi:integrase